MDYIVDVLVADGDADEILGHARVDALLFSKLLVSGVPWVDGKGLPITDTVRLLAEDPYLISEQLTWPNSR